MSIVAQLIPSIGGSILKINSLTSWDLQEFHKNVAHLLLNSKSPPNKLEIDLTAIISADSNDLANFLQELQSVLEACGNLLEIKVKPNDLDAIKNFRFATEEIAARNKAYRMKEFKNLYTEVNSTIRGMYPNHNNDLQKTYKEMGQVLWKSLFEELIQRYGRVHNSVISCFATRSFSKEYISSFENEVAETGKLGLSWALRCLTKANRLMDKKLLINAVGQNSQLSTLETLRTLNQLAAEIGPLPFLELVIDGKDSQAIPDQDYLPILQELKTLLSNNLHLQELEIRLRSTKSVAINFAKQDPCEQAILELGRLGFCGKIILKDIETKINKNINAYFIDQQLKHRRLSYVEGRSQSSNQIQPQKNFQENLKIPATWNKKRLKHKGKAKVQIALKLSQVVTQNQQVNQNQNITSDHIFQLENFYQQQVQQNSVGKNSLNEDLIDTNPIKRQQQFVRIPASITRRVKNIKNRRRIPFERDEEIAEEIYQKIATKLPYMINRISVVAMKEILNHYDDYMAGIVEGYMPPQFKIRHQNGENILEFDASIETKDKQNGLIPRNNYLRSKMEVYGTPEQFNPNVKDLTGYSNVAAIKITSLSNLEDLLAIYPGQLGVDGKTPEEIQQNKELLKKFKQKPTPNSLSLEEILKDNWSKVVEIPFSCGLQGLQRFLSQLDKLYRWSLERDGGICFRDFISEYVDKCESLMDLASHEQMACIDKIINVSDIELAWWNELHRLQKEDYAYLQLNDSITAFNTFIEKINEWKLILPNPKLLQGCHQLKTALATILWILEHSIDKQAQLNEIAEGVSLSSRGAKAALQIKKFAFLPKEIYLGNIEDIKETHDINVPKSTLTEQLLQGYPERSSSTELRTRDQRLGPIFQYIFQQRYHYPLDVIRYVENQVHSSFIGQDNEWALMALFALTTTKPDIDAYDPVTEVTGIIKELEQREIPDEEIKSGSPIIDPLLKKLLSFSVKCFNPSLPDIKHWWNYLSDHTEAFSEELTLQSYGFLLRQIQKPSPLSLVKIKTIFDRLPKNLNPNFIAGLGVLDFPEDFDPKIFVACFSELLECLYQCDPSETYQSGSKLDAITVINAVNDLFLDKSTLDKIEIKSFLTNNFGLRFKNIIADPKSFNIKEVVEKLFEKLKNDFSDNDGITKIIDTLHAFQISRPEILIVAPALLQMDRNVIEQSLKDIFVKINNKAIVTQDEMVQFINAVKLPDSFKQLLEKALNNHLEADFEYFIANSISHFPADTKSNLNKLCFRYLHSGKPERLSSRKSVLKQLLAGLVAKPEVAQNLIAIGQDKQFNLDILAEFASVINYKLDANIINELIALELKWNEYERHTVNQTLQAINPDSLNAALKLFKFSNFSHNLFASYLSLLNEPNQALPLTKLIAELYKNRHYQNHEVLQQVFDTLNGMSEGREQLLQLLLNIRASKDELKLINNTILELFKGRDLSLRISNLKEILKEKDNFVSQIDIDTIANLILTQGNNIYDEIFVQKNELNKKRIANLEENYKLKPEHLNFIDLTFQQNFNALYQVRISNIFAKIKDKALAITAVPTEKLLAEINENKAHFHNSDEATAIVIANLCEIFYRTYVKKDGTHIYPNPVQLLSVIHASLANRHLVIAADTGEGKSIFMALQMALRWLEGRTVDVCTSSMTLATRDWRATKDFLETVCSIDKETTVASRVIEQTSSLDDYKAHGIHFSTMQDLALFRLRRAQHPQYHQSKKGLKLALLLDEIDKPAQEQSPEIVLADEITSSKGELQTSDNPYAWMYPYVNNFVDYLDGKLKETEEIDLIKQTIASANKNTDINPADLTIGLEVKSLYGYLCRKASLSSEKATLTDIDLANYLKRWIPSAREARNIVLDPVPIFEIKEITDKYGNNVKTTVIDETENKAVRYPMLDARWSFGVNQLVNARLQQIDHANSRGKRIVPYIIEPETKTIAKTNNREGIRYYQNNGIIIGATATPGHLEEIKEFMSEFGIGVTKVARYYPDNRVFHDEQLTNDYAQQANAIKKVIKQAKGNPVAIICPNAIVLNKLKNELQKGEKNNQVCGYNINELAAANLLDKSTSKKAEKQFLKKAGELNVLSFSTLVERGSDIQVPEGKKLVLIKTSIEGDSGEIQIDGRGGRKGAEGDIYGIYNRQEIQDRYEMDTKGMSLPEIKEKIKQKVRKQRFEQRYEELLRNDIDHLFQQLLKDWSVYLAGKNLYAEQMSAFKKLTVDLQQRLYDAWEEANQEAMAPHESSFLPVVMERYLEQTASIWESTYKDLTSFAKDEVDMPKEESLISSLKTRLAKREAIKADKFNAEHVEKKYGDVKAKINDNFASYLAKFMVAPDRAKLANELVPDNKANKDELKSNDNNLDNKKTVDVKQKEINEKFITSLTTDKLINDNRTFFRRPLASRFRSTLTNSKQELLKDCWFSPQLKTMLSNELDFISNYCQQLKIFEPNIPLKFDAIASLAEIKASEDSLESFIIAASKVLAQIAAVEHQVDPKTAKVWLSTFEPLKLIFKQCQERFEHRIDNLSLRDNSLFKVADLYQTMNHFIKPYHPTISGRYDLFVDSARKEVEKFTTIFAENDKTMFDKLGNKNTLHYLTKTLSQLIQFLHEQQATEVRLSVMNEDKADVAQLYIDFKLLNLQGSESYKITLDFNKSNYQLVLIDYEAIEANVKPNIELKNN